MAKAYSFGAEDFSVRLPWFYFDSDFAREKPWRVWSFEVNGLTELPQGDYTLRCRASAPGREVEFSRDGREFKAYPTDSGWFEVRDVSIRNFMLSFYLRDDGAESTPPITDVVLIGAGGDAPEEVSHKTKYVRRTLIEERPVLKDWPSAYRTIMTPAIGCEDLKAMVRDIASWIQRRQVMDPSDVHYGAVYSEEDKYDFLDAAAAAVVCMRMCAWTGQEEWRKRAEIAKEYVYKGQNNDRANKVRFGGFPAMRSFETKDYCRLQYPLPAAQGVATCIIANLLVKLFEGVLAHRPMRNNIGRMEVQERDLDNLEKIGVFIIHNESHPGVFRHHEGDERGDGGHGECQNGGALGAGALCRIARFLKRNGRPVPKEWMDAVKRGVGRLLIGQEAIGVWPYLFAAIGRGQAYSEQSLPDHGMLLYHLLQVMEHEPFRSDARLHSAILRAARWYLCMTYVEPGTELVNLAFDPKAKGVAFSSFAWCRFMCAASLARISRITGERQPWWNLSLKLMEYVRKRLWNSDDPHRAPVVRSCIPDLKPVTWIQAVEWDAVLLLELVDAMPCER